MAKPRMDFSTFVGKLLEERDGDVLREGVRVLAQALMDTEVTALVGAERHERRELSRPHEAFWFFSLLVKQQKSLFML